MAPLEKSQWLRDQIDQFKNAIQDYANTHAGPGMNEKYNSDMRAMQDLLASTQTRHGEQDAHRVLQRLQDDVEKLKNVLGQSLQRLSDQQKETQDRLDLLTEAIAVSHMKNDDDKCIRGCWACHVIDVMKGLKAARTLMGETK